MVKDKLIFGTSLAFSIGVGSVVLGKMKNLGKYPKKRKVKENKKTKSRL